MLEEIFYSPLESIISGGNNKMSQMGAAHCLCEFFRYLQKKSEKELMNHLTPRYLSLFIVYYITL